MSFLYPWTEANARVLLRGRSQLPHALLLSGPRGLGKTDFGMWLAGMLLCETPEEIKPCGRCQHCQLVATASHPDLHVVTPEAVYKNSESLFARYAVRYAPEDKSRESRDSTVIRIDQVRSLIEACQKRPQMAARKVFVLAPAEALNMNAANSLLKILEEPPADSHFLLITHQLSRLPATIISRCVRSDFAVPEPVAARAWLKSQGMEEGSAAIAAALTNNAPLQARALAGAGLLDQRYGLVADLNALLFGKDDPVSCAARWKGHGAEPCLVWLQGFLADLAAILAAPDTQHLRNPDLRDQLQGLKNRLNLFQLLQYLRILGHNRSMLSGALDEQLVLDDTLIRWAELGTTTRE
jgi:DNA polymerase-3 subunit delta'